MFGTTRNPSVAKDKRTAQTQLTAQTAPETLSKRREKVWIKLWLLEGKASINSSTFFVYLTIAVLPDGVVKEFFHEGHKGTPRERNLQKIQQVRRPAEPCKVHANGGQW